jgi:hypothetical protein
MFFAAFERDTSGPRRGGDDSPITVSSDPVLQFRAVDAITDLAEELTVDRPLTRSG